MHRVSNSSVPSGWIEVARGYLGCSDPSLVPAEIAGRRPRQMSDEERRQMMAQRQQRQPRTEGLQFEISSPHMQDFVNSIRSRKDPIAPVEVGCSTNTLCNLGNIATELGRPVKWNPATLQFVDDAEAANHRLTHYEYRRPYSI
jgi:hypothetical protein